MTVSGCSIFVTSLLTSPLLSSPTHCLDGENQHIDVPFTPDREKAWEGCLGERGAECGLHWTSYFQAAAALSPDCTRRPAGHFKNTGAQATPPEFLIL